MTEGPSRSEFDGNAAAGRLLDVFVRDVTAARARCGHCRREAHVAEAIADVDEAGVILRCRGCSRTLLTYLHAPAGDRLVIGELVEIEWPSAP